MQNKWYLGRLQKRASLFLPDQHLGRNTAYDLGIPLDKMAVWDPHTDSLEYDGDIEEIRDFMERTLFCHQNFTVKTLRTYGKISRT